MAAYERDYQAFRQANRTAKTDADWKAVENMPGRNPALYATGFLMLAEEFPGTPEAEDALIWVAAKVLYRPPARQAVERLARDHAASAKLAPAIQWQARYNSGSKEAEDLLRAVVARNPNRDVRGLAHYWLARFLVEQEWYVRALQHPTSEHPRIRETTDQAWGPGTADRLRALDAGQLVDEARRLYERVVADFADVTNNDPRSGQPKELGGAARIRLDELNNLIVGKTAPEIEGRDLGGRPFKLTALRGKVVVLDFGSYFY